MSVKFSSHCLHQMNLLHEWIYRSRMSARQCLEHPWMAQHAEAMSRIALPTEKLKKFIVRRKWQSTFST
ncbi:hypothetical protein E2986_13222 [Frieseomelitta varia]|uniref:Uncharacterized protein n=1 Tax=Frieseomelitta varia TaxID=561572 RepID=A0A833WAL3_9HYME|nr:hypothetical protein E2986_13222 [Frieseomelitta varia]